MNATTSAKTSGEMKLVAVAVAGPTPASLTLKSPGPIVIGRRTTCDLVLDDLAVLREHAVIRFSSHSTVATKHHDLARRVSRATTRRR